MWRKGGNSGKKKEKQDKGTSKEKKRKFSKYGGGREGRAQSAGNNTWGAPNKLNQKGSIVHHRRSAKREGGVRKNDTKQFEGKKKNSKGWMED